MKMFYSPTTKGFYSDDYYEDYAKAGTWPDDLIEITLEQYSNFLVDLSNNKQLLLSDGGLIVDNYPKSKEDLALEERFWRNAELVRADYEINKWVDSDPSKLYSLTTWKKYRVALRNYPNSLGFPDSTLRPTIEEI